MEVYASEQEQIEAIKKWVKENVPSIIIGVSLGLGAVVGIRTWSDYQDKQAALAAKEYLQVINAVNREQKEVVLKKGGELMNQYGNSPYAALTALAMAKVELEDGDSVAAQVHLRWTVEHGGMESLRHIARQRLIRVLLEEGALDAAEQLLAQGRGSRDMEHFSAGYDDLSGDLLLARGDAAGAKNSYQQAMQKLPLESGYRWLLELKQDNAGPSASTEQP